MRAALLEVVPGPHGQPQKGPQLLRRGAKVAKLICKGCGGARHVHEGSEARWYYECTGKVIAMDLNEFHGKNWKRMHEAFAPAHNEAALLVCIGEEIGELCGAVLGVTGEKKRKAHKTKDDVRDACADAATYLSLLLFTQGFTDIGLIEQGISHTSWEKASRVSVIELTALAQEQCGALVFASRSGTTDIGFLHAVELWFLLGHIAFRHGASDWHALLRHTFNMVSERAGSSIRVH
jgi:hypothetical protein